MEKQKVEQILLRSITNLEQRRGKGTLVLSDIETEVINNACLYILKTQKAGQFVNPILVAQAFTNSATELIPQYTEQYGMIALMGIQQNIAWGGMWDFLRDYFRKNHGINIDDVQTNSKVFYSTSHKRYESDRLVSSESEVDRTINLRFTNDNKELMVSIEPSLSPKTSTFSKPQSSEKKLVYLGTDPDYKFIVLFDSFGEVEQFILELPNRKLRIEYFE